MNFTWQYMFTPVLRNRVNLVIFIIYALFILGIAMLIMVKRQRK
ncbi:hypothetical protein [Gottschalkia purinilytica]|nr:hypothetical protein [Gottschalkia purinilytica]